MTRSYVLACLTFAALCFGDFFNAQADDWPQWRGPQRDGEWREEGVVEKFASKKLPWVWRAEISSGYSGPTVAEGRVFVTDRVSEPEQIERIHCFDEKTGERVWSQQYPSEYRIGYEAGPRASVTIDEGRAYALGAMGHFHCLDAAKGSILWKRDLNQDYQIEGQDRGSTRMPIWGLAAAPLIYDDSVILHIGGRDGACVVALDKVSGEERWRALNDRASYSSPILIEQAGQRVLVCWTGDSVSGLDPKTGKVHWRDPFPPSRMPIGIATPLLENNRLFVTSFYDGSLMLQLADKELTAKRLWHKVGPDEQYTEALHSIISTPLMKDGHIYGVDSHGELRCIEAATGKRIWENRSATSIVRWGTIHFVEQGDRTWMFNQEGEVIIAQLSPQGYEEIARAKLLDPTTAQLSRRGGVCWSHPAYANRHIFARNDKELVCASLVEE